MLANCACEMDRTAFADAGRSLSPKACVSSGSIEDSLLIILDTHYLLLEAHYECFTDL